MIRLSFLKYVLISVICWSIGGIACAIDPYKKVIVFGTTVGDLGEMVKYGIRPILERQGYQVKLIEFTDYIRPNLALAEGALDINSFQHRSYLDNFVKKHQLALSPLTQIPTAGFGLYPGKLKNVLFVKAGTTVAVPNDPSNEARALIILHQLGWIKLKEKMNPLTASERDIEKNIKGIKIIPLEAGHLPRIRQDVDFSIIPGNYATSARIKLSEALFQEKGNFYINWAVARTIDTDKRYVQDVIAAYNSPQFRAYVIKTFPSYKRPSNWGNDNPLANAHFH